MIRTARLKLSSWCTMSDLTGGASPFRPWQRLPNVGRLGGGPLSSTQPIPSRHASGDTVRDRCDPDRGGSARATIVYGRWALDHPERLRIVAVADPRPDRLERFADAHGIPASHRFDDPDTLLSMPRIAPAAIIASPDRTHHRHVLAALRAGYHVLAEKPMAATLAQCVELVEASAQARGTLHIGHVLRFTPFFQTLREVVTSGRLGDIVTVEHRENVRSWHMAHSYVRGNWGKGEAGHADDRRQVLPRLRHPSLESRLARHSPFLGGIACSSFTPNALRRERPPGAPIPAR